MDIGKELPHYDAEVLKRIGQDDGYWGQTPLAVARDVIHSHEDHTCGRHCAASLLDLSSLLIRRLEIEQTFCPTISPLANLVREFNDPDKNDLAAAMDRLGDMMLGGLDQLRFGLRNVLGATHPLLAAACDDDVGMAEEVWGEVAELPLETIDKMISAVRAQRKLGTDWTSDGSPPSPKTNESETDAGQEG